MDALARAAQSARRGVGAVIHRLPIIQIIGAMGYGHAMTGEALIAEAGRRLSEAAPEARVILFGSHARGDADRDSDLDLLVIESEIKNRNAEFVRLRKALRGLDIPIDLVLVTSEHIEEWGHFEGTMLGDALREGRVLAETHA